MKTLKTKLNSIDDLSREVKLAIETNSKELINKAGAKIQIDSVENEVIQLSVNNINGKRTSKYELLDFTYNLFSDKIPEKYRLIIKV